jgi:hypothetical protein
MNVAAVCLYANRGNIYPVFQLPFSKFGALANEPTYPIKNERM